MRISSSKPTSTIRSASSITSNLIHAYTDNKKKQYMASILPFISNSQDTQTHKVLFSMHGTHIPLFPSRFLGLSFSHSLLIFFLFGQHLVVMHTPTNIQVYNTFVEHINKTAWGTRDNVNALPRHIHSLF